MAENVRGQRNTQDGDLQEDPQTDSNVGSNRNDHQNASANQGGVKDMRGNGTGTSDFGTSRAGTGSGLSTKQSVSGSDFDGQTAGG